MHQIQIKDKEVKYNNYLQMMILQVIMHLDYYVCLLINVHLHFHMMRNKWYLNYFSDLQLQKTYNNQNKFSGKYLFHFTLMLNNLISPYNLNNNNLHHLNNRFNQYIHNYSLRDICLINIFLLFNHKKAKIRLEICLEILY